MRTIGILERQRSLSIRLARLYNPLSASLLLDSPGWSVNGGIAAFDELPLRRGLFLRFTSTPLKQGSSDKAQIVVLDRP